MNGAIADPAVRKISTPKVSKITIRGNNQNFFLTRRKPQRSLMNSIIGSFLIRFLYVFASESMISNDHYRIFTSLEVLQFQGIKAQKFPRRSQVVVESCWRYGIMIAQPLLTVNGDGQ